MPHPSSLNKLWGAKPCLIFLYCHFPIILSQRLSFEELQKGFIMFRLVFMPGLVSADTQHLMGTDLLKAGTSLCRKTF